MNSDTAAEVRPTEEEITDQPAVDEPGITLGGGDSRPARARRTGERHHFAERLAALATAPGVYLMKDADGHVIYVGKAQSLRDRVRSYFGSPRSMTGKTRELVRRIADFEVIRTDTPREALILENELIKRYLPHYNILLKDDKTYPYLKITDEEWPRVVITRRVANDGGRYFGPITTGGPPQRTLDLLERLFQFRKCTMTIKGDQRPCLYYHLHRCLAPCASKTTPEDYEAELRRAGLLLQGKDETIKADLIAKRDEASEELQFERAQRYQEDIRALEHVLQRQKIVSQRDTDADVIAVARGEGGDAAAQVLNVRNHKIHGTEHLRLLGARIDDTDASLLSSFVEQYYATQREVPPLLILAKPLLQEDLPALADFLRARRGGKVEIVVPQRGERIKLVQMTAESAAENLAQDRLRWLTDEQKMTAALSELQDALGLSGWPRRIECFDISNTQGTNSVASMVVFEDARPKKSDYRKFAIKTVDGPNDFASMNEVIGRRFKRLQTPDATDAAGWSAWPDLIIVDGGKGQLGAALEALRTLNLDNLPIVGLAKQNEELYLPGRRDPVMLPRDAQALYLVQRVRDEAHRFALTYHRQKRTTAGLKSSLDDVRGIGPKRKKQLITHFGSVKQIKLATVEEIAAAPGMTHDVAERVKAALG
ncbi:MAG: excinuclease ABC subunit UvrC [Thermomicrobiales bacterium]